LGNIEIAQAAGLFISFVLKQMKENKEKFKAYKY